MKRTLLCLLGVVAFVAAGCGSTSEGTLGGADNSAGEVSEGQLAGIIMTGSGSSGAVVDESQADLNAQISKALSQRVEEELNAQLKDPEIQAELAAAEDAGTDISKDVRVGLGSKGITVFIEDEELPFAGGTMILNGEMGLKLRFRPGFKIDVVASGELTSELKDVQRAGETGGLPYVLALNGSNKMSLDGVFSVTIKKWKVSDMSAELISKIVASDVKAEGSIAGRAVAGTVNMMDVGLQISNPKILSDPDNFAIQCSGNIEAKINDKTIGVCKLAPTCLSCE